MKNKLLHELVAGDDPQKVFAEIKYLVSLMVDDFDYDLLDRVQGDLVRLFKGDYPGYRASNTEYHDLEHTCLVALAATRLMHGFSVEGGGFSANQIMLGIMAACFHDTGLIQTAEDTEGSGAKYTVGHEQRSIVFMAGYLKGLGIPEQDIEDCGQMIRCTILKLVPADIPFRSEHLEIMGKIVGSADLLAQMADRFYLEKLPLLFRELKEGGIKDYSSAMELLENTEKFYSSVARIRLNDYFGGIAAVVRAHFRERWNISQDLYAEAIGANISYLAEISDKCRDIGECYGRHLRRGGILKRFFQGK